MRNLKWTIAYDGRNYLGWQNSIEAELEKVISRILRHSVTLQAASRTDAGVHAEAQVVNCFTSNPIPLWKLYKGANSLLPPDIVVKSVEEADLQFHPTLDAKEKTYTYRISTGRYQMPQHRHTAWHCYYRLDLGKMRDAAKKLVGKHDFSAFSMGDGGVRELKSLIIEEWEGGILLRIVADAFLYRMARIIAGTLRDIGRGRINDAANILTLKRRELAGLTAPAHGLSLSKVDYKQK